MQPCCGGYGVIIWRIYGRIFANSAHLPMEHGGLVLSNLHTLASSEGVRFNEGSTFF